VGFVSTEMRQLSREFRFFVDDSFGGLVMKRSVSHLGAETLQISEKNPAERLRSLRKIAEVSGGSFLAVDGRGPYFEVPTGLINLARSIQATIVPLAVSAIPSIRVPNTRVALWLPVARSHVTLNFGEPLRISTPPSFSDVRCQAGVVREALRVLHSGSNLQLSDQPLCERG
jgi:lysophospholipid acyltransferase (LPLAT)-like uncharacterized protein